MVVEQSVVLRHIKIPEQDSEFYLSAKINEDNDLVLMGWEVTPEARKFFGNEEHEYTKTIRNNDLALLRKTFNIIDDINILDYLSENYTDRKSFEFETMITEMGVPFELNFRYLVENVSIN